MPHFLDTNVLLYSISRNPADAAKREKAISLLTDDDGALSIQVFQEFYVQATRATRPDPLPHHLAAALIETWSRFRIQAMTLAVLNGSLRIRAAHGFSFWDSAIISAAQSLGCNTLFTEDLHHGQEVGGLTVINPFLAVDDRPGK